MTRILVTGATGFLGKRVCRGLTARGADFVPTSLGLGVDLRDTHATLDLFDRTRPDVVLNCAAHIGGIQFGIKYPGDIFAYNMRMLLNLLEAARLTGIRRLVNPISNCSYPDNRTVLREDQWWDGPLHESVRSYGFVRKATWVGCWAYAQQFGLDAINLIMSNMYGPDDHFDEERSHALGALIMKCVRAKLNSEPEMVLWGTGTPVREWLHIDDAAEAMIRAMDAPPTCDPVNVGTGTGISIRELAEIIRKEVGYDGRITVDPSKPDGAAFKTLNCDRGRDLLGWQPTIDLVTGIRGTVEWYLARAATQTRTT